MSSLAEGADCLIVKHILKRPAARLIVPLPLRQDDFLQDFVVPQAKAEFYSLIARADKIIELAACSSREKSYGAAADFLLRNCDILLAVWDGRAAQGKGGTGHVVNLARELGLPIAWVHAGNRKPGTNEPTSLGEEQGVAEFERLDTLIENRARPEDAA